MPLILCTLHSALCALRSGLCTLGSALSLTASRALAPYASHAPALCLTHRCPMRRAWLQVRVHPSLLRVDVAARLPSARRAVQLDAAIRR